MLFGRKLQQKSLIGALTFSPVTALLRCTVGLGGQSAVSIVGVLMRGRRCVYQCVRAQK